MKKVLKRTFAMILVVVMVFGSAPLSGLVGLELPKFNSLEKLSESVSAFFDSIVINAKAEEATSGTCGANVTWTFDKKTGTLAINGIGEMKSYGYTELDDNYYLQTVYAPWFEYAPSIKSVIISDGITSIGEYSFYHCKSLVDLTIPDSVINIGECALNNCTSLTEIFIPDSVINLYASLNNVIEIGGAFSGCTSLETIYIGSGLENVGERPFDLCRSLVNIVVSHENKSFSSDEYGAFFNKDKTILYRYPGGCKENTIYAIPSTVTEVSPYAFCYSTSLEEIIIPDGVTSIENNTFENCTGLTSITIPDSVTSLGTNVFEGCTSLKSVYIGSGLVNVSEGLFDYCGSLVNIIVSPENKFLLCDENGVLFSKDKTALLCFPGGRKDITSYVIPSSVMFICHSAFSGCQNLLDITIPDSVEYILDYAFRDCVGLTEITIPDSVTVIECGAFWGCTGLTNITITDSVRSIDDYAFFGCSSLTSIVIPESLEIMGDDVFRNCKSLKNVTIENCTLISETCDEEFFAGCPNLENLTINSGIVRDNVFVCLDSLVSLNLGVGVTSVDDAAFVACFNLKTVSISETVEDIGLNVWSYCFNLEEISVDPNNPNYTSVDGALFNKNKSVLIHYPAAKSDKSFTIPLEVESIDPAAFIFNKNLENIYISPDNDYYTSLDGVLYNKEGTVLYCYPNGNSRSSYLINEDVEINPYSLVGCKNIENFYVSENNKLYSSVDGVIYNKDKTELLHYPIGNTRESYTIPESVLSITYECFTFWGCTNLENVYVAENNNSYTSENGVLYSKDKRDVCYCPSKNQQTSFTFNADNTIYPFAFMNCGNIKSIKINSIDAGISYGAFYNCQNLEHIYYVGDFLEWIQYVYCYANKEMHKATIHYNYNKNHTHTPFTQTIPATCTVNGMSYDICLECGETVGETTIIPATGHSYGEPEWTWTGYDTATAKFICKNDTQHTETVDAEISYVTQNPTCTEDGKTDYTASVYFNEQTYTSNKTEILKATDHKWSEPEWTWDGYNAKTATFICLNDNSHVETVEAVTTSVTTEPTCTEDGRVIYTATAQFNGKEYTDSKTQMLDAIGHKWKEPEWIWKDYSISTAQFVCENDSSHIKNINAEITSVTTNPTCTEDGKTVYTGTAEFEGETYSNDKTKILPALGHKWSNPEWTWDGYTSANAKFVCGNDNSHIENLEAVITSVRTEPTCTKDGKIVYTATVKLENKTYTSTQTEVLKAIGHDWAEPQWIWNGYALSSAKFVCKNDSSHVETADAVITSVTTDPTCTEDGKTVYTATVEFNEKTCSDEKTEVLKALGHKWSNPEWTWNGFDSASAEFICENDNSHIRNIDATISSVTVTYCTEHGSTTYTAMVYFEGNTYYDKKVETVDATGHSWNAPVWTWLDYSAANAEFICDNDNTHTQNVSAIITSVTTEPTCTQTGKTVYTATITFNGKEYTAEKTEVLSAKGHSYSEWHIDSDSSCWIKGKKSRVCSECQYVDYADIPEKPHAYKDKVIKPTCTKDGYTKHTCSVCDYSYTDASIKALGHSYSEWIIDKETSVLAEGEKHRVCSVCNFEEKATIERISVDVSTNTDYGVANFTVVNAQTKEPIKDAQIFISTEKDGENTFVTDENGKASVILPVGEQSISAYYNGMLPRNLTVTIKSGTNDISAIGLSDKSTYDAELNHELMTKEEIIAAGIDVNDPSNNHVYKYELKLNFGAEVDWQSIFTYFNADGIPVISYGPGGNGGGNCEEPPEEDAEDEKSWLHYHVINDGYQHGFCKNEAVDIGDTVSLSYVPKRSELDADDYVFDGWYEDVNFTKKISSISIKKDVTTVYGKFVYIGEEPEEEHYNKVEINTPDGPVTVIPVSENFYLIIRGSVTWLKEMFDVEMLIINNSMTDTLEDLTATLTLPKGLSLAAMIGDEQTNVQKIAHISEGESESVHWYVRGDTAGSYDIEARLQGTVMPFNESIDDYVKSKNQLQVLAGNALHLHFEFPDIAYYGEDYPITITLENVSGIPLYNVTHILNVTQGMETYYSDGTSKKKIEIGSLQSANAPTLNPGDKIIIETSVNIFFESEVLEYKLNKLSNMVTGIEQTLNAYNALKKAANIINAVYNGLSNCSKAIDNFNPTLLNIDKEKLVLFKELSTNITSINQAFSSSGGSVLDAATKFSSSTFSAVVNAIAQDPGYWLMNTSVKDIENVLKSGKAIYDSVAELSKEKERKFNIFDSIRAFISSIPIRFVLDSVVMTEDPSNTTQIPWSYTTIKTGPRYFGIQNIGKFFSSLLIAGAGEYYEDNVPGFMQFFMGSDDPFGKEEAIKYIQQTENEIARFQAKDSTGEIKYKAWIERADSKEKSLSTMSSEKDFEISCNNDNSVIDENGVLTFTGEGVISVIPRSMQGGTLYIQNSEGKTYTYVIDVVEKHICVADEKEVIIPPTANNDGFAVRCCEVCDDILEVINLSAEDVCETHKFGEWITENEPTCTKSGCDFRRCSVCETVEYRYPQVKGHSYGNAEWIWNGFDSSEAKFVCENDNSHIETVTAEITSESTVTCLSDGKITYTAAVEFNGEKYTDKISEQAKALGHKWSEWKTVSEPTVSTEGTKERVCSVCDEKETEKIPKLPQRISDPSTGIEIDAPGGVFDGAIKSEIKEVADKSVVNIVDENIEDIKNKKVYDISASTGETTVQPTAPVTVRIPIPDGYSPENSYVYRIDSQSGKVEKIEARQENGYFVFETDKLGTFGIIEIEELNFFQKLIKAIVSFFQRIGDFFKSVFA